MNIVSRQKVSKAIDTGQSNNVNIERGSDNDETVQEALKLAQNQVRNQGNRQINDDDDYYGLLIEIEFTKQDTPSKDIITTIILLRVVDLLIK